MEAAWKAEAVLKYAETRAESAEANPKS